MAWPRSRRAVFNVAATVGPAALFWFGTGLHPMGWLTWLAPLPILLLALRAPGRVSGIAAFTAYLVGLTNVAHYYLVDLELPIPLVLGLFGGLSLVFWVLVLLFRALVLRGQVVLATVTLPRPGRVRSTC